MDSGFKDAIVENVWLVSFVVNRMSSTLSLARVEKEDAFGYGVEGLIKAVRGFDPERNAHFSSYAVPRIRGAIIDALRRQDPLPRSVRRKTKALALASRQLATDLSRDPTEAELAERVGMATEAMSAYLAPNVPRFLSLEQVLQSRSRGQTMVRELIDDDELSDPAVVAEENETRRRLIGALRALPPREKTILEMRYLEEKTFREIADRLGLSEARICQLHKRATRHLRQRMEEGAGGGFASSSRATSRRQPARKAA